MESLHAVCILFNHSSNEECSHTTMQIKKRNLTKKTNVDLTVSVKKILIAVSKAIFQEMNFLENYINEDTQT